MKEPIYAILVVYNRDLADCPTFHALQKSAGVTTFVCDNSTEPNENAACAARYGMRYISMGGNCGLPKAYNRALDAILREESGDALICIFDDDTSFTPTYFEKLRAAHAANPAAQVLLPLVYDQNGLLSPCKRKGVRFVRCGDCDVHTLPQDQLYGINSGMALHSSALRDNRYDEGYFLDYVDFALQRTLKEQDRPFLVFDAILQQDFFAASARSAEQKKARDAIFQKDFSRFCSVSACTRLSGACYLLARRIKKIFRK